MSELQDKYLKLDKLDFIGYYMKRFGSSQEKALRYWEFLNGGPPKPIRNRAQCKLCKDIIESEYRHDFVECKCGEIFTDGGLDYIRRGAKDLSNIIDLPDDNTMKATTGSGEEDTNDQQEPD